MTITLDNAGKRFGRDWIFRKLSCCFHAGKSYAILGPNGSGKSTLLQLLACNQSPTEGTVRYSDGPKIVGPDDVFRHISLCAPYMELIEEFTLTEQLRFHFSFKKAIHGMNHDEAISLLQMQQHAGKQLRHFSSGMKQRVKLCLSVLTDVPVVLLDEPAVNLDEDGIGWYKQLLQNYLHGRLLIVSSNRNEEHEMCKEKILLEHYKHSKMGRL